MQQPVILRTGMSGAMRLFVSVDITDVAVAGAIARMQEESGLPGAVRAENMHYTLMFLGEVGESEAGGVAKALGKVSFEPFDMRCSGLGSFPSGRGGRIVWVGADADGGQMLKDLASKVAGRLKPLGFAQKGRFRPHATVFRVKSRAGDTASVLKRFENAEFGIQRVDSLRLKSSVPSDSGSSYGDVLVVGAKP